MAEADQYRIRNETSKRLTVKFKYTAEQSQDLILPPLAEALLTVFGEAKKGKTLQRLGLDGRLAYKKLSQVEKTNWEGVGGVLFVVGVLYWSFGRAFVEANPAWAVYVWQYVPSVLAVVGLIIAGGLGFGWVTAGLLLTQTLALLCVIMTGVGLSAATIWYFGDGQHLLRQSTGHGSGEMFSPALLGRLLQFALISIASLIPALLYFLFDRYRLGTLRESFEHHIFRLDPNVRTLADVRAKYGRQLDELYGRDVLTAQGRHLRGTRWPIWVCTLVITIGWVITLQPIGAAPWAAAQPLLTFVTPSQSPVVFGFLGAYYFAITSLLRRYTRGDLRPKAYSHIVVRIFVVLILTWIVEAWQGADRYALTVSFVIGVLPDTFWTAFNDFARNQAVGQVVHSLKEKDPLTNLEGIDLYDRARLAEEGVSNVESLAHHDLIDLMLATRIPIPRLVDWMDQAVLYLHVPEEQPASRRSVHTLSPKPATQEAQTMRTTLRQSLRRHGIRTATDFMSTYDAAQQEKRIEPYASLLAGSVPHAATDVSLLQVLRDALADDEWITQLRHWRGQVKVEEDTVEVNVEKEVEISLDSYA